MGLGYDGARAGPWYVVIAAKTDAGRESLWARSHVRQRSTSSFSLALSSITPLDSFFNLRFADLMKRTSHFHHLFARVSGGHEPQIVDSIHRPERNAHEVDRVSWQ